MKYFPDNGTRIGIWSLTIAVIALAGCTITQTVNPISIAAGSEVCIVENSEVRAGFLDTVQQVLTENGYRYRMLAHGASPSYCPVALTYTAQWSWDLSLYMSYARLQAFQDGYPAGNALYDSTKGGGNMKKFIDAEPKITELVEQLFPRHCEQSAAPGCSDVAVSRRDGR